MTPPKVKGNMYGDRVEKAWNPCVGCNFDCYYCRRSFQAQMKRQKHNCKVLNENGEPMCYTYEPHFHPERLNDSLPKTKDDQFVWPCSSGDIACMKESWINKILEVVKKHDDKTFFFQSKDPECFNKHEFPQNVILAITLETNRDHLYHLISSAPPPQERIKAFLKIEHPRKRVTIEPILTYDLDEMVSFIKELRPEITYVGYDSKKCRLPEPRLSETRTLINKLAPFTRVKEKKMRERWEWAPKFKEFKEATL